MQSSYLKYYNNYSPLAPLRFGFDAWREKSPLRKLAIMNRLRDYSALQKNEKLLELHLKINEIILRSLDDWDAYDYGEGYFYQSFEPIGIRGFRNTEERVAAMNLRDYVLGKRVIDIGCNCGFLDYSICGDVSEITGFDINPFLIEIGKKVGEHLGIENVHLTATSFEDWNADQKFDVVMSFANHSTFDELTRYDISSYFEKCAGLLKSGSILLFESHTPDYEGKKLQGILDTLRAKFNVTRVEVLKYGTFLDTGRTFLVATNQ